MIVIYIRLIRMLRSGRLQFEVGACQPEGMCIPVELAVDVATLAPAAKQVPCKG